MSANVIIAQQLFDSLDRLAVNDRARVIQFIHRFRANPEHPGLGLEPADRARSKDVWSGRVSIDLRAILFKDADTWAIVYVDHHEPASDWAARQEIGRHSVTGALQIVESVETAREVERIVETSRPEERPPLFEGYRDEYLLSLGVPEIWLPALRVVCDNTRLLDMCQRLPVDVANRLMDLAQGQPVTPPEPIAADRPALEAADTSEFYAVDDAADLVAALKAPMERWIAFLHSSQLELVKGLFRGPVKVSGSAGTGKTVVAMHRARHLALQGEKVLLTTVAMTLCENIKSNLALLCSGSERHNITVSTVYSQALELVHQVDPEVRLALDTDIDKLLSDLRARYAARYDPGFVRGEWDNVVRRQGISSWSDYKRALRAGRSRSLSTWERRSLWKVFGRVIETLARRKTLDSTGIAMRARELLEKRAVRSPYTAVIVDEVQDLRPAELRFIRALSAPNPRNLMLVGDAGQRIFPGGFTLSDLDIDVRGRSTVLRINYRTTERIRRFADQVLDPVADDLDGGKELRDGTRSLIRGTVPVMRGYETQEEELSAAVTRILSWLDAGHQAAGIGVFAPSKAGLERLDTVLTQAGIPWRPISGRRDGNGIQLGTMHQAKGLEFRLVLLIDCSESVIPGAAATAAVDDPLDREAALDRERQLLYVAMTRACHELVVSWSGLASPFLEPLLGPAARKYTRVR
jgi:hypothetical protein